MTIQKNPPSPQALNMNPAARLPDTAENLAQLKKEAAQDGKPSVVAKAGGDLLLLSGAIKTESAIARLTAAKAISNGDAVSLNGVQGTVLHTDDGFKEINQTKVTVAVIDGGFDVQHPALKDRLLPAFNADEPGADVSEGKGAYHGTHVAGIIAGSAPEAGLEGVAQGVSVLPIKATSAEAIAAGIRHAADNGAKVINISQGMKDHFLTRMLKGKDMELVEEALQYAEKKGALVVVASGNSGGFSLLPTIEARPGDSVLFPANTPTVVAVGNLNDHYGEDSPLKERLGLTDKKLHDSSSKGPDVDLAAPGTNIQSSVEDGKFKKMTGTSMAAPYVAGIAALIAAQHPDWTPAQIREQLFKTADDLGREGKDRKYGHGAIDPIAAVFGE